MTSITSDLAAASERCVERGPSRPGFIGGKVGIPRPSFPVLRRSRVTELISDAARHRVTLVCAPTGSGKTVACASWADAWPAAEPIVWVTAEAQDSRDWFWAYLCAGLQRAGVGPLEVIQSLEDASPARFPLRLVGAARLFSAPVVLVLDNVHKVTDEAVLNGLAFLIHHAPAGLRLVLAGCGMPAGLQLARLPMAAVADIGPRQLACTAEEAGAFLATLGIDVDAAERDELVRRTEGCMACLRLAATGAGAGHAQGQIAVTRLRSADRISAAPTRAVWRRECNGRSPMTARFSPAGQALVRARAAAAYARRTGCGIGEAGEAVRHGSGRPADGPADWPADGSGGSPAGSGPMSRRAVLQGAGAAAVATMLPVSFRQSGGAPPDSGHRPRVVIIGSGLAGLGCALRLWRRHGIRSEIYEFNSARPGGRVHTLRGFFDAGQFTEQHGEFISSEHTAMRRLAAGFGLTLDNVNRYPPDTRPQQERLRFGRHFWPQAALNREWHDWAFELFFDAANRKAPWPTLHNHHTRWGRRWDHTPATHWIEQNIRGGLESDFGRLCIAVLLDEYGGPAHEQSALNLIYLLGLYDSSASGLQPRRSPQLSGTDEKWHIRGGNDQLVSGLVGRLPTGTVRLGERLVALRRRGHSRFTCTFARGLATHDVPADHVVLALPFTRLREVELRGIDLPPRQLRAIRHEPLGSNSKIQMQFSRRVWNADRWTGNMYDNGVVQGGWETTIDQPGTPGILIALPGGAVGADIGRRYRLTSYAGPAPAAMAADYLEDFETSFPGARAAFNGKAFYAWSSGDPHIGGAYSYLKVGQYTAFNGIQGQRHGNLHFAGEHTSLNFQGYMEGALRSGYRCSAEIAG